MQAPSPISQAKSPYLDSGKVLGEESTLGELCEVIWQGLQKGQILSVEPLREGRVLVLRSPTLVERFLRFFCHWRKPAQRREQIQLLLQSLFQERQPTLKDSLEQMKKIETIASKFLSADQAEQMTSLIVKNFEALFETMQLPSLKNQASERSVEGCKRDDKPTDMILITPKGRELPVHREKLLSMRFFANCLGSSSDEGQIPRLKLPAWLSEEAIDGLLEAVDGTLERHPLTLKAFDELFMAADFFGFDALQKHLADHLVEHFKKVSPGERLGFIHLFIKWQLAISPMARDTVERCLNFFQDIDPDRSLIQGLVMVLEAMAKSQGSGPQGSGPQGPGIETPLPLFSIALLKRCAVWKIPVEIKVPPSDRTLVEQADYYTGICYEEGIGVPLDLRQAATFYEQAANEGYAPAQHHLAGFHERGIGGVTQDLKRAADLYRQAASQEYAPAQSALGYCHATGCGLDQDLELAIDCFQQAAEQGDALAQYNLGYAYFHGIGVHQDRKLAASWLQRAADQGYAMVPYTPGQGFSKRLYRAAARCEEAAKLGYARAQVNLAFGYRRGIGVPRDTERAFELLQQAADQGDATAKWHLGYCYLEGCGVRQDAKRAFELIQPAAEQGEALTKRHLGHCYLNGLGVPQDAELAVYWFLQAADHGNIGAWNSLGRCYGTGLGVPRNDNTAVEWYQRAADQGWPEAQFNLGSCYEKGLGVSHDLQRAKFWIQRAADQGSDKATNKLRSM